MQQQMAALERRLLAAEQRSARATAAASAAAQRIADLEASAVRNGKEVAAAIQRANSAEAELAAARQRESGHLRESKGTAAVATVRRVSFAEAHSPPGFPATPQHAVFHATRRQEALAAAAAAAAAAAISAYVATCDAWNESDGLGGHTPPWVFCSCVGYDELYGEELARNCPTGTCALVVPPGIDPYTPSNRLSYRKWRPADGQMEYRD
jgi:cell wall-associated NlpC family hydrolase